MKATVKKLALHTLLKLPWIGGKVEAYRIRRPLREAERYIDAGALYLGEEREAVLGDFREVYADTQLGVAAICNLESIARYVTGTGLEGAFVECGTWRGGATAYFARSVMRNGGICSRNPIYGFDSFEGMPRMTRPDGEEASAWLYGRAIAELDNGLLDGALVPTGANVASEESCRKLIEASGYDKDYIHIVKGWFQEALPVWKPAIGPIAILRLDADLYEATKFCLETLYDGVVSGGVVIIDDYGWFEGCGKAVDEFMKRERIGAHLFHADAGAVYFFKP